MTTKPISSLAAVIALHGGPTPEQFREILVSLDEASIDSESYDFGPAFANAEGRLVESRRLMRALLRKL